MANRPPTWTILNHLPPGPGEGPGDNNIVRDEKVYLFQDSPGNKPKVLYLFSDGNFDLVPNAHPSEGDVLELIGHSNGLLCFKNKSKRRLLVWDIDSQTVRRVFDDVDEVGESSYGFGRIRGHFMVVRLGRQPLFFNGQTYGYYLHTFIETEREVWNRIQFRLNGAYDFTTGGSAIYVAQNDMMYWKAEVNEGPSIITYQLATEQVGSLVCPVEAVLRNTEMAAMVLGHGFKRQLSAAVYVPPARNGGKSFLHIWVLLKELDVYRWHKLVALRLLDYTSVGEVFVPLIFYYGSEGGEINLILHRNKQEIVRMIPAEEQAFALAGADFRRVPVSSSIPSGIRMEHGTSRKFQATPIVMRPI